MDILKPLLKQDIMTMAQGCESALCFLLSEYCVGIVSPVIGALYWTPWRGHRPGRLCTENEKRNLLTYALLTYIFLQQNIYVPVSCHLIQDEMM